jgi:O-antigen/teichoic acid export membrane protein
MQRMQSVLERLHARLGDFWWYSLMLFCACRAADLLNAFVGLWLVPKYVGTEELGAVMPLTQFANFLAIPVAAFANTFRNELTRLSIGKEFGKLKTLMRGVFVATAVFLFLAILLARILLPAFLERIRIVEGSLGIVIIAASFVSAVAPIYTNALQALKKFKAQSVLSVVGAPVRLITMLVAMPFRAITGYFVGQAATPAFSIVASVVSLRKELSAKAELYWTNEVIRRFSKLFATFAIIGIVDGIYLLVEPPSCDNGSPI